MFPSAIVDELTNVGLGYGELAGGASAADASAADAGFGEGV